MTVNVSERSPFSQVIPDHSNVLFYLLKPAFKICLTRKRETDGYGTKLYPFFTESSLRKLFAGGIFSMSGKRNISMQLQLPISIIAWITVNIPYFKQFNYCNLVIILAILYFR